MRTTNILLMIGATLVILGAGCKSNTPQLDVAKPLAAGAVRTAVDCGIFGKPPKLNAIKDKDLEQATAEYVARYKNGDRGYLPKDFLDVADGATFCGSIADQPSDYPYLHNASFYISSLSPDDLFAWFKAKLVVRGCTTDGPVKAGYDPSQQYMPFSCADGHGTVNPDYFRQAYSINFDKKK